MGTITLLVRGGSEFVKQANGQSVASQYGGRYTPAHMKNGSFVSACWRGTVFCVQGQMEGKTVHLTVWNGQSSKPGQGSADRMAKDLCAGRLCLITCELDSYKRVVTDPTNGAPLTLSDGTQLTQNVLGLKYVPGSMFMLDHSVKMLAFMWSQQLDVNNFFSELPLIPSTPQYEQNAGIMKQIWAQRNAMPFQPGMQFYGRAVVQAIPQGAQYCLTPPAGYQRPTQDGQVPAQSYGTVATPAAPAQYAPAITQQHVAAAQTPVTSWNPSATQVPVQQYAPAPIQAPQYSVPNMPVASPVAAAAGYPTI